ncbi:sigma-54-dependent Fis family transcriptional regulator [Desulfosporosinus metallidurans]|uniref:Response regulator of zinc sigma-54-dependent two-component system n=1 Tax=Desulfosporosinus metallidurans TaxID=1888891 RepID=A0A1Q8QZ96_9FIRM|nr:sigma 54-interacting transcriptional regulator [Desulfosporosinus metallidurans]OLN32699.1 Response regulator of zinc sigma-54-dependent two-component system [Desulfosporosinus metallidurans]
MYNLRDIKSTVQQTADAIAAALKIEVEIADADLIRVAGTGKYKSRCGYPMDDGFVYGHVMKTGVPVIIDNPGFNELCQPCPCRGNCLEYAEVAIPIRSEDQIIGVIGLVSFDEEQTKRLMDNKQSLLLFLEKMADLLVGKVVENQQNHERELLTNQLLTVLNLLHDGILLINDQQQVTHFNTHAGKLLDIDAEQEQALYQLLDDKKLWKAVERGETFSGPIQGKRVATQLYCDVVPITNNGSFEGAVVTLKDIQQIKKLVKEATVSEIETHFSQIIGNSSKMNELKTMALRVAPSKATLLIQGESGTGKELLARAIHQSSNRKGHAFIAINCGAIPENLLESELFGYEEGSFTGARRGGKLGKFELAHNGTIFLDEIGDMPLHLQVKILRVLQERRVERVGSNRSIPLDVRVIAATHRDLDEMVKSGEFREDLFYRLNVIPLTIPPLRERQEDIPILIQFYLDHYSTVTDKVVRGITPEAIEILTHYPWPGNVREMGNVIEYCVTMVVGEDNITPDILPKRVKTEPKAEIEAKNLSLNLKILEREAIMKALTLVDAEGHKDDAAKLLGISRATLYRKIKDYNIGENKTFF